MAGSPGWVARRRSNTKSTPSVSTLHTRAAASADECWTTLLNIAADSVVHLEVRTDNDTAIALYRSVGFTEVGVRRRYYRISGADAYTMRREAL